jgi:HK97 family phage prohead protease
MPWSIKTGVPGCSGFAVVKQSDGKVVGCHPTKAKAQKQLAALNINAKGADMSAVETRLPRENLVRAMPQGIEVREASEGGRPTLFGHFARFNEWAEIRSIFEGDFMEQIAPGAFSKTFNENRSNIKATFQHGGDPSMGDQILGPIEELREDDTGAYYEIPLFEGIPPLVMSGLRAGAYGSSFRFRVTRDDVNERPGESDHNPDGLPERTIKEAQVMEFGPVTFPAYAGTSAAVRSMTDELLLERAVVTDPKHLAHVIESILHQDTAPSDSAGETHPAPERRESESVKAASPPRFRSREEFLAWIAKG